MLAGDALLTQAFKILANRETHQDAHIRLQLIERLADSSGALGMVGGQMIDMLEDDSPRDLNTITRMQRMKTGALISYSVEAGAIIGGATDAEKHALHGFAHDLGLAYQIADDLLDATGNEADVGKPLRTDETAGKANFVTILGVEQAGNGCGSSPRRQKNTSLFSAIAPISCCNRLILFWIENTKTQTNQSIGWKEAAR